MNIINEYHENMQWLNLYGSYDTWYKHIRDHHFPGELWCAYEEYNEEDCFMFIDMYEDEKKKYLEYLHPISYAIVSRQVAIDLLYVRISQISMEKRVKEETEKAKKSCVIIDQDFKVKRI